MTVGRGESVTPTRILLHGVTGSGKTALARRIAEAADLPCHLVDHEVGWLPDWVERPLDEQRLIAEEIAAAESWVLDSAYGKWRDVVLARTQLIVALDYPRAVSLSRLLRRTAKRIVTSEQVCNGNIETIGRTLSSDSIIAWHFRNFGSKRAQIDAWSSDPTSPTLVRLSSPRAAERWLEGFVRRCPPR